jgi:hypothetical protein
MDLEETGGRERENASKGQRESSEERETGVD